MFYLGIDQHARQITISLRDEGGDVVQARQVSTQPERVHAFFQQLTRERLTAGKSFVAVLEVCGFIPYAARTGISSSNSWNSRVNSEAICCLWRALRLARPSSMAAVKAS